MLAIIIIFHSYALTAHHRICRLYACVCWSYRIYWRILAKLKAHYWPQLIWIRSKTIITTIQSWSIIFGIDFYLQLLFSFIFQPSKRNRSVLVRRSGNNVEEKTGYHWLWCSKYVSTAQIFGEIMHNYRATFFLLQLHCIACHGPL